MTEPKIPVVEPSRTDALGKAIQTTVEKRPEPLKEKPRPTGVSEKVIRITCTKGVWAAELNTIDNKTFISKHDFNFINRALLAEYRRYAKELSLRLRMERRLANELKDEVLANSIKSRVEV